MKIKKLAKRMVKVIILLLVLCSSWWWQCFAAATDTITSSTPLSSGEVITSSNGKFQMGFFSPVNSTNRYLGIWRNGTKPSAGLVWVAYNMIPSQDLSQTVNISEDGNLVVMSGAEKVWSSSVTVPKTLDTKAQLLDTGNLVLVPASNLSSISTDDYRPWKSFQDPSNVLIKDMEVGFLRTGGITALTSWKSPSDPSQGNFSAGMFADENVTIAEFYMWKNNNPYWRSGPWNGRMFIGTPSKVLDPLTFVMIEKRAYVFTLGKSTVDFILEPQGKLVPRYLDGKNSLNQSLAEIGPTNECDLYNRCGPFAICDISLGPYICSCLGGFEPLDKKEWNRGNWTSGCVRSDSLQCTTKDNGINTSYTSSDVFWKVEMVKVPASAVLLSPNFTHEKCELSCHDKCDCFAYAYDSGLGCMIWSGIPTLNDIQAVNGSGVDLYIRIADPKLLDSKKKMRVIIITTTTLLGTAMIFICAFLFIKARRKKSDEKPLLEGSEGNIASNDVRFQELPVFKFEDLATATNSFNLANKLGQGGFGTVYKGTLQNGLEIAVKRLSSASRQGLEEFMNEVLVISKLQHRNLVKLLGCCANNEEKILVYEYMPNNSLGTYLFDSQRKELQQWEIRFNIIEGISRGLLYLHRDSRLRIIHRDLKASNILLDGNLIPKISDFGMARIFGGNEDHANTRRVVGTYGYMAPEYAIEGLFSEKSDVFSFGVLLLEIISGRKNTSFYNQECLNLLGYAWKLWEEDNILAFVDEMVYESCHHGEVVRCINVGLLCVQERGIDRPTMSTVILMLTSEIVDLPSPKEPAFTQSQFAAIAELPEVDQKACSINNVTMTMVEGR